MLKKDFYEFKELVQYLGIDGLANEKVHTFFWYGFMEGIEYIKIGLVKSLIAIATIIAIIGCRAWKKIYKR